MLHKSVLATILLGFLVFQFSQAVPVNNEDLASAFQEFSKKAVAEILSQKRHLEELEQAIEPLIGQLNNGTNSKDTNVENIQVIARDIQSLRAAVEANERSVAEARMATSQCGGFIPLDGKQELLYEIPPGIHYANCIWVLWNKKGGSIRVKNEPNSNAQFHSSFKLLAVHNFRADGIDQTILTPGSEQMLGVNASVNTFAVLFFQANVTKLGQGFHLKFEGTTGMTNMTRFRPKFKLLSLSQSSGTLKYPSGLAYNNDERVFAIGRVPEGKSMNLKFDSMDTEAQVDWFRIMWLKHSSLDSVRYSGSVVGTRLVPGGCSYIILFVSDVSVTRSGMQMSYNVNDSNVL